MKIDRPKFLAEAERVYPNVSKELFLLAADLVDVASAAGVSLKDLCKMVSAVADAQQILGPLHEEELKQARTDARIQGMNEAIAAFGTSMRKDL